MDDACNSVLIRPEYKPMLVSGICAICGAVIRVEPDLAHRELPICDQCGSSPRFCGLALAVSRTVWGDPDRLLVEQPPRREVIMIGVSDDNRLARVFSEKFCYVNTRYDAEPRLDLCSAESCRAYQADLIICSDVLEHTVEPPALPLLHLFNMLKPGGTLILSAPTFLFPSTVEWYGGAERVEVIEQDDGRHVVRWRNRRGTEYLDDRPVFHGGPGFVLEMRIISHSELLGTARAVGFVGDSLPFAPEWGYVWPIVQHLSYITECADARIMVLSRPPYAS